MRRGDREVGHAGLDAQPQQYEKRVVAFFGKGVASLGWAVVSDISPKELVARVQAAPGKLHVLLVWDRKLGDGEGGASDFAEAARHLDAKLQIIAPLDG
mgnify:CR=1 FL=1